MINVLITMMVYVTDLHLFHWVLYLGIYLFLSSNFLIYIQEYCSINLDFFL